MPAQVGVVVTVSKGRVTLGNSLATTPSSTRGSSFLVGASFVGDGAGQVARPAGPMVVRLYSSSGRGVWWSGAQRLSNGTVRVNLPALPRGSYRADIAYGGDALSLGASQSRTFTVR
ncbi:hypothetical protein [Nocardioides zeae]